MNHYPPCRHRSGLAGNYRDDEPCEICERQEKQASGFSAVLVFVALAAVVVWVVM